MARNRNNILARGFSGMLGDQFVLRIKNGVTFLANRPTIDPDRSFTEEQLARQENFKAAVEYARKSMENPVTKAMYEAAAKDGQSAYNMALTDAAKGPRLSRLVTDTYRGQVGDTLKVRATDNFRVETVTFAISREDGTVVEAGLAVADENGLDWIYTVTQPNAELPGTIIAITAIDIPKNTETLTALL